MVILRVGQYPDFHSHTVLLSTWDLQYYWLSTHVPKNAKKLITWMLTRLVQVIANFLRLLAKYASAKENKQFAKTGNPAHKVIHLGRCYRMSFLVSLDTFTSECEWETLCKWTKLWLMQYWLFSSMSTCCVCVESGVTRATDLPARRGGGREHMGWELDGRRELA